MDNEIMKQCAGGEGGNNESIWSGLNEYCY